MKRPCNGVIELYVKAENVKIHADMTETAEYIGKHEELNKYFGPLRERLG